MPKHSYVDLLNAPRVQGKAVMPDGSEVACKTPESSKARKTADHTGSAWSRPLASLAASVTADKAQEYNEFYRKHGITGAEHDQSGRLTFSSRKERAKCLKLRGLVDFDGGYSD